MRPTYHDHPADPRVHEAFMRAEADLLKLNDQRQQAMIYYKEIRAKNPDAVLVSKETGEAVEFIEPEHFDDVRNFICANAGENAGKRLAAATTAKEQSFVMLALLQNVFQSIEFHGLDDHYLPLMQQLVDDAEAHYKTLKGNHHTGKNAFSDAQRYSLMAGTAYSMIAQILVHQWQAGGSVELPPTTLYAAACEDYFHHYPSKRTLEYLSPNDMHHVTAIAQGKLIEMLTPYGDVLPDVGVNAEMMALIGHVAERHALRHMTTPPEPAANDNAWHVAEALEQPAVQDRIAQVLKPIFARYPTMASDADAMRDAVLMLERSLPSNHRER